MTTQRITDANLQAVVDRINRLTGSPLASWGPNPDTAAERGSWHVSNVGNFHLDHAYGGVALYRMCNALRELENAAYLLGLALPDDTDAGSRYLAARQGLYSMLNIWED